MSLWISFPVYILTFNSNQSKHASQIAMTVTDKICYTFYNLSIFQRLCQQGLDDRETIFRVILRVSDVE